MKANFKRFIAALLALTMTAALCAVSLPVSAKTAEATNLIANPGFETGTADPWLLYADSALVSDAYEGSYALRVCSNGSYAKAARQQNIPFEANTDYVLTYWAKGDPNTDGTKGYHTYIVGGSDYHNTLASNSINLSSEWTQYTIEFNSGEYTFGYVNFSCGSPDTNRS